MKKIAFFLASIYLIGGLAISCTKELENEDTPSVNKEQKNLYSFAISEDSETKAILGSDATGRFAQWESGDVLGYMIDSADSAEDGATINTATTPVTFSLTEASITSGSTLYAFYPYYWECSDATVQLTIPNQQSQSASTGFNLDHMPMIAEPITITSEMVSSYESDKTKPLAAVKFANLGSLINFKVFSENVAYQGEKVKSISYNSGSAYIAGTYTISASSIDFSDSSTLALGDPSSSGTLDEEDQRSKVVTTTMDTPVAIGSSKGNALDVYMVVAPGEYSGTITVTTDFATYTYTLSGAKTYARSGVKSFGLNLSSANATRVSTVKTLPYTATFLGSSKDGGFEIENVSALPDGLSFVWKSDSSKGWVASGYYSSKRYVTNSRIVSPLISLHDAVAPVLTFDHTGQYFNAVPTDRATLWIKVLGGDWAKVTIPTYFSNNNWTYVSSGEIDLSAYVDNYIQLAFHYTSDGTSSDTGTWDIKNFSLVETSDATITVAGNRKALSIASGTAKLTTDQITVSLENPADPSDEISVTVEASATSWLSAAISEGKFQATAAGVNANEDPRVGKVTLTARGADPWEFTVTQASSLIGQPSISVTNGDAQFSATWTGIANVPFATPAAYRAFLHNNTTDTPETGGTELTVTYDGEKELYQVSKNDNLSNGSTYYLYVKAVSANTGYVLRSTYTRATVAPAEESAEIEGLPATFSKTSGSAASSFNASDNTDASLSFYNNLGVLTNMNFYSGGGFAAGSMAVNAYFLMTIPVKNVLSTTEISVTMGGVKTSNKKYKATYQVSWSTNGSDYTNVGDTFQETTTASSKERTFTPGAIADGTLYIKVKCTGLTNPGGNHYLGTVTVEEN